ncbi:MAG: hypothetical protein NT023_05080 [Armatimonadetes bacterium]|nr:hypothetical protein [Armatimonadota bacterium]
MNGRETRKSVFGLVCMFLCFGVLSAQRSAAESLRSRLERVQTAIEAHRKQTALQEISVYFNDGTMDVHTESKEIVTDSGSRGQVVTTKQNMMSGASLRIFRDLPTTFVHPLHRLPNQFDQKLEETGVVDSSVSVEGAGKTAFRGLRSETIEGVVYEVLEFTQYLPKEKETPSGTTDDGDTIKPLDLVCTKLVCKLYIGKDGLIRRKSGVIYYKVIETPGVSGKPVKKVRTESTKFESKLIVYRDAPAMK